jgi:hypothetical protein
VLKREFRPEWGYLAADRRSIRTLRAILIATTVGAVAGGAIVLLVSGTPEDSRSVATRSLIPPEVEAIARTSVEISGKLPPTEPRLGLPLAAPAQSNVKTGGTRDSGDAWLSLYAEPAGREPIQTHMARIRQRGNEQITYERQGPTWIVASGYHGDRIFYRKAMLACAGLVWHQLAFEYPTADKRAFDQLVTRASYALQAYGQVGCHR